jgi:hypothetical protein
LRPLWPGLHCEVPPRMMRRHPSFESVMGLLRIRKDRDETRKLVHLDRAE